MAKDRHGVSIRVVCQALSIRETCYRYQVKLSDDNALIVDWLVRLTHRWKVLGFWLLLSVFTQCGRLPMEPQACLAHLPGVGTELTDQTQATDYPGKTAAINDTRNY